MHIHTYAYTYIHTDLAALVLSVGGSSKLDHNLSIHTYAYTYIHIDVAIHTYAYTYIHIDLAALILRVGGSTKLDHNLSGPGGCHDRLKSLDTLVQVPAEMYVCAYVWVYVCMYV
jgi:hypothetical protein